MNQMRRNKSQGMSLVEIMLSMSILAMSSTFVIHSYMASVRVDQITEQRVIAHKSAHAAMEKMMGMTTEEIIKLQTYQTFEVIGIPKGQGTIDICNATNQNDTESYASGVMLKIVVKVYSNDKEMAKLTSFKWDGTGKITPPIEGDEIPEE